MPPAPGAESGSTHSDVFRQVGLPQQPARPLGVCHERLGELAPAERSPPPVRRDRAQRPGGVRVAEPFPGARRPATNVNTPTPLGELVTRQPRVDHLDRAVPVVSDGR